MIDHSFEDQIRATIQACEHAAATLAEVAGESPTAAHKLACVRIMARQARQRLRGYHERALAELEVRKLASLDRLESLRGSDESRWRMAQEDHFHLLDRISYYHAELTREPQS